MQTKVDSWTEQWASYLIQEDVTVVHQYFDIHRSQNRLEPEKRLMLAVLQDALFCFQRYFRARSGRRQKLFWKSWQWFNGRGAIRFLRLRTSVKSWGLTPLISGAD